MEKCAMIILTLRSDFYGGLNTDCGEYEEVRNFKLAGTWRSRDSCL